MNLIVSVLENQHYADKNKTLKRLLIMEPDWYDKVPDEKVCGQNLWDLGQKEEW